MNSSRTVDANTSFPFSSTPPVETNHNHNNNKNVSRLLFSKISTGKQIVFFSQIILIYVVIITCLVNLTFYQEHSKQAQLWIALLSGCLGYVLPNPSLGGASH